MDNKNKDLEHCDTCGCGHDHDHEEMDVIYLTLDDDSELECGVIGIFEVEDKEYIALLPIGEEEVLLYEYKDLGEEDFDLLPIEDEEEFELVSEAFYALYSDEEEYDEELDEEEEDEE